MRFGCLLASIHITESIVRYCTLCVTSSEFDYIKWGFSKEYTHGFTFYRSVLVPQQRM